MCVYVCVLCVCACVCVCLDVNRYNDSGNISLSASWITPVLHIYILLFLYYNVNIL